MKASSFLLDLKKSNRTAPARIHQALKDRFGERYRNYDSVSDSESQKAGVDLMANFLNGPSVPIELKTLSVDPTKVLGCLALPLETFSSVEKRTPGFLLQGNKETRYMMWLLPNGSSKVLPFRALAAAFRRNFRQWKKLFRVTRQRTVGRYETYTSECVWVPVDVIEAAMRRYLLRYSAKFGAN